MGSAILTNAIATSVSSASPSSSNYDVLGRLQTCASSPEAISYIFFTRPFPLGATILSAKLYFYTQTMGTGTHTFTFQRLNQSFSASKVTYNTRPTSMISGTKAVTMSGSQPDLEPWELDVTDWMQTISSGGKWYGWRILGSESTTRYIYSENHTVAAYRPRLEVSWSDAPETPGGLSPAGGRAVGLAKPVLKGVYRDVSGSTQLAFMQVQLNATDSWGAPTYDSGLVGVVVPEFDLNNPPTPAPAYAGLADGATTFWRVRFQDAAGVPSSYSAAASFKRDDKGTLTVNSPPSGTPTVEDATPPILWTFTGETQAAYQVQIRHVANNVQVIDWDSGKVTSTATSVTVPSGKINEPSSTTYTVTVRIWDNKQREATPGDPTYVEVVRNFTFVPGATVGTTGLTVVAGDPRPKATLTWQRTSAPDAFNILRNSKVIAAGLLPGDLFVSGTTYTYVDNSPSPGRALTYSVQGVVGGVASASNATAVVTVRSSGIWLREPVSGLELCLAGRDSRSFTLTEMGVVLQAIAPTAPEVVINQTLGGLKGTIVGTLENIYGKTAQQWRDQYLQLRALRVKKCWLTVGDSTIQVVAHSFEPYEPLPTPEIRFRVGFAFAQQDSVNNLLTAS
jgi:hypothetical protein